MNSIACVRGEATLFEDLNLSISNGQCVHLQGANGSGKTSLLKILSGINRPDSGQITWNDQAIHKSNSYHRNCIYLAHKDGLKNELSAIENLRFYQHLDGLRNEDKLDDCLLHMGLLDKADLTAQQLSFGQRRRLAFARCLLKESALWILDEPFTGIDSQGRNLIESACLKHLEQGGMIVLTHHRQLSDSLLAPYLNEIDIDDTLTEREAC